MTFFTYVTVPNTVKRRLSKPGIIKLFDNLNFEKKNELQEKEKNQSLDDL